MNDSSHSEVRQSYYGERRRLGSLLPLTRHRLKRQPESLAAF